MSTSPNSSDTPTTVDPIANALQLAARLVTQQPHSAPPDFIYDRWNVMQRKKKLDLPTAADLKELHGGSWASVVMAYGFTHVGRESVEDFLVREARDVRRQKWLEANADGPASEDGGALGDGGHVFVVPWRGTVYGSTTVRANTAEEAAKFLIELTDQQVFSDSYQVDVEPLSHEITEIEAA